MCVSVCLCVRVCVCAGVTSAPLSRIRVKFLKAYLGHVSEDSPHTLVLVSQKCVCGCVPSDNHVMRYACDVWVLRVV